MRSTIYLALLSLAGCADEGAQVSFVCTEPLEKYLFQARENIANDYEVERSHRLLRVCPEKGFHRRYVFSVDPGSITSKGASDASVSASWCVTPGERHADAKLTQSTSTLTFDFTYPWSTETGKYPRTEFRLNRFRLKGGFSEELDWDCEMESQSALSSDEGAPQTSASGAVRDAQSQSPAGP